MNYLEQYFFILNERLSRLVFMISFIGLSSILDLLSIGALVPFIGSVFSPDSGHGEWWKVVLDKVAHVVGDENTVITLGSVALLLFYIKGWVTYILRKRIVVFSMHHLARLRNRLMKVYQQAPYSFLLSHNSAELIQSINGHTTNYVSGTLMMSLHLLAESITFIVLILLLASVNFQAVLFAFLLLGGVLLLFYLVFKDRIYTSGRETNISTQEVIRGVNEGMRGFKEIRVLGVESFFYNFVRANTGRFAESTANYQGYILIPRYLIESCLFTFIILISLYIQSSNVDSTSLIPVLGIFGVAALRLLPAATTIMHSINHLRFSRHSMIRVYQDLKVADSLEEDTCNPKKFTSRIKDVPEFSSFQLQDICYRYPSTDKDVINDISLTIRKGQSVGLVGTSGVGKTTFINLILGLLTPRSGKILLNGNILKPNSREWMDLVAYIPQTVFLTDNTLRNNIALGVSEDNIDEKALNGAIVKAQLMKVVAELPDGLDTRVGEDGVRLSGGQCQRVAIARALYHKREVIIMDEATSALDSETEQAIIEEVSSLKGRITFVIIAHSASILSQCDVIYKMHEGSIKKV